MSIQSIRRIYDEKSLFVNEFALLCDTTIENMKYDLSAARLFQKGKIKKGISEIKNMWSSYKFSYDYKIKSLKEAYIRNGYDKMIADSIISVLDDNLNRYNSENNYLGELNVFILCGCDGIELKSANYVDEEKSEEYGRYGIGCMDIHYTIDYPATSGSSEDFEFSFIRQRALIEAVAEVFAVEAKSLRFSNALKYFIDLKDKVEYEYDDNKGRSTAWFRITSDERKKETEHEENTPNKDSDMMTKEEIDNFIDLINEYTK